MIHLAEAPFEGEQSRAKYGPSPIAYLEHIGLLGPDIIGAHCIWVDAADIEIARPLRRGLRPQSFEQHENRRGVIPVVDMIAAGQPIGLATDGAASNNDLDMFEEMDLAAKLQKIARLDPRALPAQQVVAMATINGARALHMEKQIGSLEAGKKADMILIDTDAPHSTPMYNVYSRLVYAQKRADVRTVVIDGKIVMEDRRMLTLDEPEILAKAEEYKKRVETSLIAPAAK